MANELVQEAAGAETGGATETGTQPADSTNPATDIQPGTGAVATESQSATEPDEFADLYEKEDEPIVEVKPPVETAPVDAPLYKTSEYVKTPEQAVHAVQAAAEVWDVQTGKKDAGEFLDQMRQYNPERYKTAVAETLAAIKWAGENGHLDLAKLGVTFGATDPNAPKEDPAVAALRGELNQIKTAEQQRTEAAQREQQQAVEAKTRDTINGIFAEVSKGKWYEGDAEFGDSVLAQMDKNGVDAKLAQTNMAEWRKGYDKALKQVHNAELKRIADRSKRVVAHQARLRLATPATPGQKGGPVTGKAKPGTLNRSAYPAGEDGRRQWQSAMMDATGFTS